jgi:hypothetical protein
MPKRTLAGMIVAVAMAVLALTGQALSGERIKGPSGQILNISKCVQSTTKCFAEAGNVCGGPYQIMDSESHAGGILADIFPGPVTWYSMTFVCGRSDGRLPQFGFRGQEYTAAPAMHLAPYYQTHPLPPVCHSFQHNNGMVHTICSN